MRSIVSIRDLDELDACAPTNHSASTIRSCAHRRELCDGSLSLCAFSSALMTSNRSFVMSRIPTTVFESTTCQWAVFI